ncbi:unnamed protein product, partial [Rotaria magnacalcarata]
MDSNSSHTSNELENDCSSPILTPSHFSGSEDLRTNKTNQINFQISNKVSPNDRTKLIESPNVTSNINNPPLVIPNQTFYNPQFDPRLLGNNSNLYYPPNFLPQQLINQTSPSYAQVLQQNIPPIQFVNSIPIPDQGFSEFKGDSVSKFNQYLKCFENYCQARFFNDTSQWSRLLINRLPQDIKGILPEDVEYTYSYEKIVNLIQTHLTIVEPQNELSEVSKFLEINKNPNESVAFFASRLLQSYNKIYPNEKDKYKYDDFLRQRFLTNLSEELQRNVNISLIGSFASQKGPEFKLLVKMATAWEQEFEKLNKTSNCFQGNPDNNNRPIYPMNPTTMTNPNVTNEFPQNMSYPMPCHAIKSNSNCFFSPRLTINPECTNVAPQIQPPHPQQNQVVICKRCLGLNHNAQDCMATVGIKGKLVHKGQMSNTNINYKSDLENFGILNVQKSNKTMTINNTSKKSKNKKKNKGCQSVKYITGPQALQVDIKASLLYRINKLSSPLKEKVIDVFRKNCPSQNFVICPHPSKFNDNCLYCEFGDPEIVRLDRVIASFQPVKITKTNIELKLASKNKPAASHSSTNIHHHQHQGINKVVSKVNKMSKMGTDLEKFMRNKKRLNNSKEKSKRVSLKINSISLPEQSVKINNQYKLSNSEQSVESLQNLFSPEWTKEFDQTSVINEQAVKRMEFYDNNKLVCSFADSKSEFKENDCVIINSLEQPVSHPLLIKNEINKIQVRQDIFDDDKKVVECKFYVNLKGKSYHALIDSGSQESSIRVDLCNELNLEIIPLAKNEVNFSNGTAGKIPILGRVTINVKFMDVDPGLHTFKVFPNSGPLCDEIVLGQDYLIQKKIKYFGSKRLIRGYLPNNKPWSYQYNNNLIRRVICDIDCKLNKDLELKPGESIIANVNCEFPQHYDDENINFEIKNFSGATQAHFVKHIQEDTVLYPEQFNDIPTQNDSIYYIVNLDSPKLELYNDTNCILNYKQNALVGYLYSIKNIYLNTPSPEVIWPTNNKFDAFNSSGHCKLSPEIENCFVRSNVVEIPNKMNSHINETSMNEGINEMNESELMSDFNPPDMIDLPEETLADLLVPIALPGDQGIKRKHVFIYIDDIGLATVNESDHLELLKLVFQKLQEHQLKLKLVKCNFMKSFMSFLGFHFSPTGVKKEQAYIDKILSIPRPKT